MSKSYAIDLNTLGLNNRKEKYLNASQTDTALFIVCQAIEDLGYQVEEYGSNKPLTKEESIFKNRVVGVLETLTLGIPSDVVVKVKPSLTQIGICFLY